MPDSDRYICEACGRRYAAPGDCEDHPDEALQDLAVENVRIMLDEFDSRRKRKRLAFLGTCALILTSPVVFLLTSEENPLIYTSEITQRTSVNPVTAGVWAGAAGIVEFVLWKLFPSRKVLPDLKAENPEWLTTGV